MPIPHPYYSPEAVHHQTISSIDALEILDSRGNPTLKVYVTLSNGMVGAAAVPSGASTGKFEAVELRDDDARRYDGKGVTQAVSIVQRVIASELRGIDPGRQAEIDRIMLSMDDSPGKAKLGANSILGVSMAVARAAAAAANLALYEYLGGLDAVRLPMPMMNILNGGKHAENSVSFQEFMVVPLGAPCFREALRYGAETFHALQTILRRRGHTTGVGDEGGFAPNLSGDEEACGLIVEAIELAGYRPGRDLALAIDPAASAFFDEAQGLYDLHKSGQGARSSEQMTALYASWIEKYPLVSIEDGLHEEDWSGFAAQTATLGDRVQIVGDDLYVTNASFIGRGIRDKATNAVLIKLNQIGTVTETMEAIRLCREAGWNYIISHRSGETEDTFIADFTVAMGGGQIKSGSACRSERIAKYNRLLEIEAELGAAAEFTNPFQKED